MVEAASHKLVLAGDGKAAEALAEALEEAAVVPAGDEVAAMSDEKRRAAEEAAYRDHIEHVAKAHPDPDVRARAREVVTKLGEQGKTEVLKAARERREDDDTVKQLRTLASRDPNPDVRARARGVFETLTKERS